MTDPTDGSTRSEAVLVVGGTGHLGGLVVDELLAAGRPVRALVRPATDPSRLRAKGVEIARGDMLDLDSLIAAMDGADAVITSAAGYTRRSKQATEIDTVGNVNLARAAARAGVRRFVLTGIVTSEQTPEVAHFWHKKLAEDALEEHRVPFVSLRPGAFFDQVTQLGGDPFARHRLTWFGTTTVPMAFILTTDLARYLAAAVDAPVAAGERIDVGWDRPVSMREIADIAGRLLGARVRVRTIPGWPFRLLGRFVPGVKDMSGMVDWFATGRFVADTTRQREVFGPVPTVESAVAAFARRLGHIVAT